MAACPIDDWQEGRIVGAIRDEVQAHLMHAVENWRVHAVGAFVGVEPFSRHCEPSLRAKRSKFLEKQSRFSKGLDCFVLRPLTMTDIPDQSDVIRSHEA
jgi:hypothetical protein